MRCVNCGTEHDSKFCPNCGTPNRQYSNGYDDDDEATNFFKEEYPTKYCQKCGAKIHEEAIMCPKCGCQQPEASTKTNKKDTGAWADALLAFLFPIIGLIMWAVFKGNRPKCAEASLTGAIIGWVIWAIVFIFARF